MNWAIRLAQWRAVIRLRNNLARDQLTHLLPMQRQALLFDLGNSDGTQCGNRAGSAYASDATGSNVKATAHRLSDRGGRCPCRKLNLAGN
jgi:hypothetical protein